MNRPVLLDSSVLIAFERETKARETGPARKFLAALGGRRIVVSIVTVEEGENDAWLVATAESLDADIVGADRKSFEPLGARYLRFR